MKSYLNFRDLNINTMLKHNDVEKYIYLLIIRFFRFNIKNVSNLAYYIKSKIKCDENSTKITLFKNKYGHFGYSENVKFCLLGQPWSYIEVKSS